MTNEVDSEKSTDYGVIMTNAYVHTHTGAGVTDEIGNNYPWRDAQHTNDENGVVILTLS